MALAARYPLTDPLGSTVADETVANRDGTYAGTPVQDACGTDFGGGFDEFRSSTNGALAPTAAGGLSCWLRWASALATSVRDWSGVPSGDNGWLLATLYSGVDPLPSVAYRVGGTEVLTGVSPSYAVGFDRHWFLAWDATDSRLYLDGTIVHTGPAPGASPIVLPWTIGKNGELNEWYPSHALDLRIYNHKPSAAEVLAVYQAGQPCLPVPSAGGGWSVGGVRIG